jgi:hypothetical protein
MADLLRQLEQMRTTAEASQRSSPEPSKEALHSNKDRRDRIGKVVVSAGLLLMVAVCGGAFRWLTRENRWDHQRPDSSRAATPSDPEAERRRKQEQEKQDREAARQTMAAFVGPLLPLAADCAVVNDPRVLQRRSKMLIWDETKQTPGTANGRLPADLRGQTTDADLTLVVLVNKRNVEVATYELLPGILNGKKIPGYRVETDVCVIDVPEKKALGRMTLIGDDPPPSIKRKTFALTVTDDSPEYGDSDGPLARWLEYRPRIGKPDLVGEARTRVADCRRVGKVAKPILGKVLIWDMAKDVPSAGNADLPETVRGTLESRDLTLVLLCGRQPVPQVINEALVKEVIEVDKKAKKPSDAIGLLVEQGTRVFREKLELAFVSFPDKEALGTATVEGALLVEPSPKSRWGRSSIVGNSDKAVAIWIEGQRQAPDGKR